MPEMPLFAHPAMALLLTKISFKALSGTVPLDYNLEPAEQFSDAQLVEIIKEHDPSLQNDYIIEFIPKVRQALRELDVFMKQNGFVQ